MLARYSLVCLTMEHENHRSVECSVMYCIVYSVAGRNRQAHYTGAPAALNERITTPGSTSECKFKHPTTETKLDMVRLLISDFLFCDGYPPPLPYPRHRSSSEKYDPKSAGVEGK